MREDAKRRELAAAVEALWPRIEGNEASLEEVRDLALRVFDQIGVQSLDRWEKHQFVWVLKGLATGRETPGAGLYTALRGVEQALASEDEREPVDATIDQISADDLRTWVAAA